MIRCTAIRRFENNTPRAIGRLAVVSARLVIRGANRWTGLPARSRAAGETGRVSVATSAPHASREHEAFQRHDLAAIAGLEVGAPAAEGPARQTSPPRREALPW